MNDITTGTGFNWLVPHHPDTPETYLDKLNTAKVVVYAWHYANEPGSIKIGKTFVGLDRWAKAISRHTDVPLSTQADIDARLEAMGERVHVGFVPVPDGKLNEAERTLHVVFADLRQVGTEFFSVTPSAVLAAMELLAARYGSLLVRPEPGFVAGFVTGDPDGDYTHAELKLSDGSTTMPGTFAIELKTGLLMQIFGVVNKMATPHDVTRNYGKLRVRYVNPDGSLSVKLIRSANSLRAAAPAELNDSQWVTA